MKKKNAKRTDKWTMLLIVAGIILGINLLVAVLSPDWTNTVQENAVSRLNSYFNSKVVLSESDTHVITAGQGGVNVQRARDNAERARSDVEGGGSLSSGTTESAETQSPAASGEKPPPAPPADPADKKSDKDKAVIDPEVLKNALIYFQDALSDRDVIWEGQSEPDRPFISKSFRDNPFDKVEDIDPINVLMLKSIPEPPFYPPPDSGGPSITADELKAYLGTVSLQGVVVVEDRFYAVIKVGSKQYTMGVGDEFKDKFVLTVTDISFENVVLADEYGNRGLIGFNYASKFEAQSIDDVLYLSYYSAK